MLPQFLPPSVPVAATPGQFAQIALTSISYNPSTDNAQIHITPHSASAFVTAPSGQVQSAFVMASGSVYTQYIPNGSIHDRRMYEAHLRYNLGFSTNLTAQVVGKSPATISNDMRILREGGFL